MFEDKFSNVMKENPEIESIILTAGDGLPIASLSKEEGDLEELSARSMAFLNNASSMGFPTIREVVVKWGEGKSAIIISVKEDIYLISIFRGGIEGKIKFYLKLVASEIDI